MTSQTDHAAPPGRWSTRKTLHALTITSSLLAFLLVQLEVPDPYLDEIFHIAQIQRYCDEEFDTWDPAITTPPGLYLLSAIPLMTVHIPCTPSFLRSTNLLFTTILIPAIISSILHSHTTSTGTRPFSRDVVTPSASALVVSSFPLIFFFGNLYYTDVASLAGVLGAYALALHHRHRAASVVGAWSISVRQTNVVWLAFILAVSLLREVSEVEEREGKKGDEKGGEVGRSDPLLGEVFGLSQLVTAVTSTINTILLKPDGFSRIVIPYAPTFLGFLVFLKWNGGIVLGHKELHKPVLHLPQLLYFLAFVSVLLLPSLLVEGVGRTLRGALRLGLGSSRRIMRSIIALGAMNLGVHYFTIYHPFLLADNRHYVFYLLRRVFLPFPTAKYLVTPIYLFSLRAWMWRLRRSAPLLWTLGFLACTALVLVPSPLIEPRYFLIPTILLRLQISSTPTPDEAVWREYAWYILINVSTLALFLLQKFRWEGWEGWMRFMW